jgi:peptidyl-prolyl cis-trans isomerase D
MALGFMRRHKRYLYVFLWLVVAAFIVLYIPAFQEGVDAGSPAEPVAEVGGEPITAAEFEREYRQLRRRYEEMLRGRDPAMLAQMGLENQVLGGMVEDRLVALEAERLGLGVSDDEVARSITLRPDLQQNGQFVGAAEVRRRLALQGMTEAQLARDHRQQLLGQKLHALLTDGVMVTPAEVEREFRRRNETVKLEFVKVESGPFRAQSTATDQEVAARFEAQKERYRFPERRIVSYLLVDNAALEARITVTDSEIDAYYRDHPQEFEQPAQVCASQIQVKVKADPAAKEGHPEAEARTIAEGLRDQAKAGADFAELARKHSEETFTAAQGGDIGCAERGQSFPPEVDAVVFAMNAGEISDPIKTSHGYHVMKVTSMREQKTRPLAEVKEQIRMQLRGTRSRQLTEQKTTAVADALSRRKSLEDAAREQELTVQRSGPLAKGEATAPLDNPALVARVFTMKAGDTSDEPFGTSRGYAFVTLLEVQPPRQPELKDVQERVKQDLIAEKALEAARLKAEEVRARAEKDGLDKAATALALVRKETPTPVGRGEALSELGTSAALEEAAYSLPEKTLSAPVKAGEGWAVIRVLERAAFDPAALAAQKESIESTLEDQKKNQLYRAYMSQVRDRFKVTRRPAVIARVVGGGPQM